MPHVAMANSALQFGCTSSCSVGALARWIPWGGHDGEDTMIARFRFRLYRWLLGVVTARDFKGHEVWPLEIPSEDTIRVKTLSP